MNASFRIHVVEDDPNMGELLASLLAKHCQVQVFTSAEISLAALQREKPDLFLVDVGLAGINGYELCRRLKADYQTRDIPITFISGNDSIETRLAGYEAGGEDFLIKPFEPPELLSKLQVAQRIAEEKAQLRQSANFAQQAAFSAMTSMGGGAIFTNDDALAHKIRGIVNHGMYERYHHDVVGVNSRLASIQAGVLKAKLPHLDAYNKARQDAARKYSEILGKNPNIWVPTICESCDCHVFHQYVIRILNGKRDGLLEHLQAKGIPCAIYYPIPLHSQKAYADSRYKEEDFPVTNQLVKEVIALPMHTELDDEQIKFITDAVLEYV